MMQLVKGASCHSYNIILTCDLGSYKKDVDYLLVLILLHMSNVNVGNLLIASHYDSLSLCMVDAPRPWHTL